MDWRALFRSARALKPPPAGVDALAEVDDVKKRPLLEQGRPDGAMIRAGGCGESKSADHIYQSAALVRDDTQA